MLRLWSVPFFLRSPQKVTTGYFLFPVLRILKRANVPTNCYVNESVIGPAVLNALKDALNNGSVSYSLRQRQTDHAPDAEIKNIEKKLSRLDSRNFVQKKLT